MTSLKPILAAILLTLTISISALAGDVSTPTKDNNQPPPATCNTCYEQESTASTEPTEPGSPGATYESVQTSGFAVDVLLALLFVF
ncbi:MAG TPA: hypothetical protein VJM12_21080 [Pyrinomonadaceae bacterium]|nr:hypothetical protein [Pyrinomonadaceae bacterium]